MSIKLKEEKGQEHKSFLFSHSQSVCLLKQPYIFKETEYLIKIDLINVCSIHIVDYYLATKRMNY